MISSIPSKGSSPNGSGPMGTEPVRLRLPAPSGQRKVAPMELNRVLIVDDDPAIRRVVSALLDLDEYGLLEAVKRLTDG
jgi:hypothetical protein